MKTCNEKSRNSNQSLWYLLNGVLGLMVFLWTLATATGVLVTLFYLGLWVSSWMGPSELVAAVSAGFLLSTRCWCGLEGSMGRIGCAS